MALLVRRVRQIGSADVVGMMLGEAQRPPVLVLSASDERRKAAHAGAFDPDRLPALDDDGVRRELTALKGIGPWTAEIYLLMVLRRPDAWPVGDLALATAAQQVKGLAARPTPAELAALAEPWRPWRAVAARVLWHHYLSR